MWLPGMGEEDQEDAGPRIKNLKVSSRDLPVDLLLVDQQHGDCC